MKPIRSFVVAAAVVAIALQAGFAAAGDATRVGTAGAQILRIPVGPRGTALSGSGTADAEGAEATFWNPAGVSRAEGTEAMFSTMSYLVDSRVSYFAVTRKLGGLGAAGLSLKTLDLGDIEVTTEAVGGPTGDVYSPKASVVAGTYARTLTDRASFGLTVGLVNETIRNEGASGVAFDIGFQYRIANPGIRFGAVMKNFGPKMRFKGPDFGTFLNPPDADPSASNRTLVTESAEYDMPASFQFGVTYSPYSDENGELNVMSTFQSNTSAQDAYRFGAEYAWKGELYVRGGAIAVGEDNDAWKSTFGIGVHANLGGTGVFVDYARQTVSEFFEAQDLVSLRMVF